MDVSRCWYLSPRAREKWGWTRSDVSALEPVNIFKGARSWARASNALNVRASGSVLCVPLTWSAWITPFTCVETHRVALWRQNAARFLARFGHGKLSQLVWIQARALGSLMSPSDAPQLLSFTWQKRGGGSSSITGSRVALRTVRRAARQLDTEDLDTCALAPFGSSG